MSDFEISNEPLKVVRTCRYGHGALSRIDKTEGKPVFFTLPYGKVDEVRDGPSFIGPLEWYVCAICGYTEIIDPSPAATLAFREMPDG